MENYYETWKVCYYDILHQKHMEGLITLRRGFDVVEEFYRKVSASCVLKRRSLISLVGDDQVIELDTEVEALEVV